MATETLSTDLLFELCDKRLQILQELHMQTLAQLEQARGGEAEELLTMLSRKQWLLDELAAVHEQIRPFQDQDPESRTWSEPNKRKECQEIADQGQALLAELLEMERLSIEAMNQRRLTVSRELQLHTDSMTVRSAYGNQEIESSSIDDSFDSENHLSLEG